MAQPGEPNPLLEIQFRIPFDRIRPDHVEPAVTTLIEEAKRGVAAIAARPGTGTYAGTLAALDDLEEPLDYAMGIVQHLKAAASTEEMRQAVEAAQPKAAAFRSSIPLDPGLWAAVKSFAGTAEAGGLAGERRRHLSKTLDLFRRHGAELDEAEKKRLSEIDVELSTVTSRFADNELLATNSFELLLTGEKQLAGLPPTAVQAARESAARKQQEGWRFTLQGPDYFAVMTYLDDPDIRRQVYRAYSTRASSGEWDNRPLIVRILELRREKARLLGYADFADFTLEDRMAGSGARALAFLEDLKERTVERFHQENRELLEFRRSLEGPGAPALQPWDVAYYAEKQRAALYDFDEEALRPYFPVESVTAGMFELVERLYGIRVTAQNGVPLWDDQVKYYSVIDAGGEYLGSFYADWHPRENKRGGAWMGAFLTGGPSDCGFRPHLGLICGNLTRPSGGRPALLTHREVETVFHEFGHLLHHLLSRVSVRSLAGTSVAWDFVELPSQIMENWCWERQALDLFARHYQTGEAIPGELFAKMKRARNFRSANSQMRQLGFGFVDLLLHTRWSAAQDGDPVDYTRAIIQQFSAAPLPPDHAMIAGFTHLFSDPVGYGAGYYSYKWAEVLEADAFTRFKEHGIFSREVGTEFRDRILSRGDSEDPAVLYRGFMGRDPDPNALLERSGLK